MRKAVHKKQDLSSLLVMVAFSLFFTVGAAFAQQPAQGGGNSASEQNVEGAPAVRKNYDDRNRHAQRETELKGNGRDAGGSTTITNRSGPYSLVPPMPVWTSNAPANYSHQDTENYTTTGALLTDTSFGIQANGAMTKMVEKAFSPERIMHAASGVGGVAANNTANSEAGVTTNQAYSAIDYCKQFLTNFTAEPGNVWQDIRDHLFIPMAVLLLLPGAVLAQVRAIIAQGSPVLVGEAHPLEGLLKSIVAIFLIPGSFLVINYGIDVANSLTYTVATEYTRIFGSDMYEDAKCAVQRAFPVNRPQDNLNTLRETRQPAAAGGFSVFAVLERNTLGIALIDPCLGIYQSILPDETVPQVMNAMRAMVNSMGMTAALSWNLSCAFQMAYLYYLWCMGPIAAALWVWPIAKMRASLGSWVEGVITICFWSLFWNTVILLLACFKGVGFTGTIIVASLLAMAVAAIRSAFDFSGMVTQAVMAAQSAAQQGAAAAMKGAGGGGGGKGGGSQGGGQAGGSNQSSAGGGNRAGEPDRESSAAGVNPTGADGEVQPAQGGNNAPVGTSNGLNLSSQGSDTSGSGAGGGANSFDNAADVPLTAASGNDEMSGGDGEDALGGQFAGGFGGGESASDKLGGRDGITPPPMQGDVDGGFPGAGAAPDVSATPGSGNLAVNSNAAVDLNSMTTGSLENRLEGGSTLRTNDSLTQDNNRSETGGLIGSEGSAMLSEGARGFIPAAFSGGADNPAMSPLNLPGVGSGNDALAGPVKGLTDDGSVVGPAVGGMNGPEAIAANAISPLMPSSDGDLSRVGGDVSAFSQQQSAKVAGDMLQAAINDPQGMTTYNGQSMTNEAAFQTANGVSAAAVNGSLQVSPNSPDYGRAVEAAVEGHQIASANPGMFRDAISNPDGLTTYNGQNMTNSQAYEQANGYSASAVQASMAGDVNAHNSINAGQARMEGAQIAGSNPELYRNALNNPEGTTMVGGREMTYAEAFERTHGVTAETVQAAVGGNVQAGYAIDAAQARMEGSAIAGAHGDLMQKALTSPSEVVSFAGQNMQASEAFIRATGVSAETVQSAMNGSVDAGRAIDVAQARMEGQSVIGAAGQLYNTAISQPDAMVNVGGTAMKASEAFESTFGVSAVTVQQAANGNIEAGRTVDMAQARMEGQSIVNSAGALYHTAISQPEASVMVGNHSMTAREAFQERFGVTAETVQAASAGNIEAGRAIDVAQARIDAQSIATSAGSVYQTALQNPDASISIAGQTMRAGEAFQARYGVSADTVQQAMNGNIEAGRQIDAAQTRSEAAQIVQAVGSSNYVAALNDPNGSAVVAGVQTTNAGAFQMLTGVPVQTVQAALGGNPEAGRVIDSARMESQSIASGGSVVTQGGAPVTYSMASNADGSPTSYNYSSYQAPGPTVTGQNTAFGGTQMSSEGAVNGVVYGGGVPVQNVSANTDTPVYNASLVAGPNSDSSGLAPAPALGQSSTILQNGLEPGTNPTSIAGHGMAIDAAQHQGSSLVPNSVLSQGGHGGIGDPQPRLEPQSAGGPIQPTGDMRMADGGGGGWGHLAQGQGHGGQGQVPAPAPDAASGWGHLAQGQGHGGQAQMPAPAPDAASGWGQAPAQPVQGPDAWRVAQANEASAQAWRAPDQGVVEQRQAQPPMPHHDGGMIAPVIIPAANRTPAQPINSASSRDVAMAKDAQAKEAAAKAKAAEGEVAEATDRSTGQPLNDQLAQANHRKMGSLRNLFKKPKKEDEEDDDKNKTV